MSVDEIKALLDDGELVYTLAYFFEEIV
jgi:hypothetical protein